MVFIDVEILRPAARSIGNHMMASDAADVEFLSRTYPNCANPNVWSRCFSEHNLKSEAIPPDRRMFSVNLDPSSLRL